MKKCIRFQIKQKIQKRGKRNKKEITSNMKKKHKQTQILDFDKKSVIEKSKKASVKDAAAINATVGFGDNYISAYAVSMNATANQLGLLTSIPNLFAPLAQLFTSKYMEKHSRKKIFSIATLFQSLFWIPIIAVSFLFLKNISSAPILLVIFYTIYALFGHFAGPAWVSWIGDLVDSKESGRFFGLRNKIGGAVSLISMILGGIILDLFKKQATTPEKIYFVFIGFGIIFTLAMFFRFLSRHYVLQQHEPHFRFQKDAYFSFFQFLRKSPENNYGRFSIYVALVTLATNIAAPYFTLYMLKDLSFSYIQFMLYTIAATIATFIFMTKWGSFADRFGNKKMIEISAFIIPLICFAFPVSVFIPMPYKLYFLLLANFITGFGWAGFNLAAGNFVYEATTPQRRGICSAYAAILNGLGVVIGATIGSLMISHIPINFMNIILFVSIISGIARLAVSFIMLKTIKDVRIIEEKANIRAIPLASEIFNVHSYIKSGWKIRLFKGK